MRFRGLGASALALITAASGQVGPTLAAPAIRDGRPTPEACAQFGYGLLGDTVPRAQPPRPRRAAAPQPRVAVAPPAGLPPPPPLEIPIPPPAPPQAAPAALPAMIAGPGGVTFPGRESYPDAAPNPVRRVSEAPVSTFSIDVDTASYANVRRFLRDGVLPPPHAVRVEEMVNYFDYGYARPTDRNAPFSTFVSVAPSPWARGKEIVHIGLQGYELPQGQKPPLNLTFLVDVSGSMSPPDRLPLAKQALNRLVDQLRPEDRVSLVVYAGAAGAVLPPTGGAEKLRIRCAVEALESGGSTAGGAGLALAYRMARQAYEPERVNRVVLMTDGDFNVGVTDNKPLEAFVAEQRKTGVYLSVYGFGRGNYQDLRMQTISQAGNGTAAYVDSLNEADRLFSRDFSRQVFPIADDVKIQVEFNPARVQEYRLIGYETRLLARQDFNNDSVDAGEVGAGASVTALYEITPAGAGASVDPLRYQPEPRPAGASREIAFLRLRYKPAGAAASRLSERPITDADRVASLAAAPAPTRLAVSVAGFGQRLRNDPHLGQDFGWTEIAELASGVPGRDPHGERSEFLQLVDTAAALRPRAALR